MSSQNDAMWEIPGGSLKIIEIALGNHLVLNGGGLAALAGSGSALALVGDFPLFSFCSAWFLSTFHLQYREDQWPTLQGCCKDSFLLPIRC